MLDVAIVGGGLCGLALAHSLQARGIAWALYEARDRLGGRVRTERAAPGLALDLGPAWYWPATQPSMTRLVDDLGLAWLEQPDDGRVLLLDDPNATPKRLAYDAAAGRLAADEAVPATPGALHGGARRLAGGMAALIEALAKRLPAARLHHGHALQALADRGDHVELQLEHDGRPLRLQARRVVLALPPRLAAQLRCEPPLPPEVSAAAQATPTWMASAAKAAVACPRPVWREQGLSGNAWVTHAQAVLGEVYDAGPADAADGAALAGFLALGADQRPGFRRGMPMLIDSQVAMLFGADCAGGEQWLQDWADEPWTCSALDRAEDGGAHPAYGDPRLQQPLWQGRLWLGGSETARHGGGYLEGALAAAARLRQQLGARPAAANELPPAVAAPDAEAANEPLLAGFDDWVRGQRENALQRYRERLHRALGQQFAGADDAAPTQRALLGALESLYDDALQTLGALPLQAPPVPAADDGRHALTPRLLAPFMGLADELLAEAMRFNATSCALSNFPGEHRLSGDYVRAIRRDLAAAWAEFARRVNQRLLDRASAATPA